MAWSWMLYSHRARFVSSRFLKADTARYPFLLGSTIWCWISLRLRGAARGSSGFARHWWRFPPLQSRKPGLETCALTWAVPGTEHRECPGLGGLEMTSAC